MGQEHLPSVDLDFVKHAEDEYHSIFNTGKSEEVDAARFRYGTTGTYMKMLIINLPITA